MGTFKEAESHDKESESVVGFGFVLVLGWHALRRCVLRFHSFVVLRCVIFLAFQDVVAATFVSRKAEVKAPSLDTGSAELAWRQFVALFLFLFSFLFVFV